MPSDYEFPGLNWEERGYAACPSPPPSVAIPGSPKDDPWLTIALAVDRAKVGDFSQVAPLLGLYDDAPTFTLQALSCDVIGDAGPDPCFPRIIETIETDSDPDLLLDCCHALASRGHLADVPLLIRTFEQNADLREMIVLHTWIGTAITDDMGKLDRPEDFSSIRDYVAAMMGRYRELVDRFGTEEIVVFQGERFGVVRLAEMTLDALRKPFFRSSFRRKFEAVTGTDCSSFYVDRKVQPLAAAAILEEFLESPESVKYEEGVRYFFGHRIPD